MTSPVTSFLSQDFESLIEDVTNYARRTWPAEIFTDFNDAQMGTYLLRTQAYIGDLLGYQLNASVMETLLRRVVRERNMRLLAQSVNYDMHSATGAVTTLRIYGLPTPPDPAYPFTISRHHQFTIKGITYQPLADMVVSTGTLLIDGTDGLYVEIEVREGKEVFEESLGNSSGLPGQQFVLTQYPVQDGTLEVTVTADGGYTEVRSFTTSTASDLHYRTYTDDSGVVTIEFGDGVLGKIPTPGQAVRATYRVTSTDTATAGNLPSGLLTWSMGGSTSGADPVPSVLQVASIKNVSTAVGGGPRETIEHARRSIPAHNRTNDRAVYVRDYGDLAMLVPGVAHAKSFASKPVTGIVPVQVRVVPTGGGAPSPGLIDAVAVYLSTRKDPARHVSIQAADYVKVQLSVDAYLDDTARRQTVGGYLAKALTSIFDTDAVEYATTFPLQAIYDAISPDEIPGLRRAYVSEFRAAIGWAEYPTLPTVGDGVVVYLSADEVTSVTREWNIKFTYPTPPSVAPEYEVHERVTGYVGSVSSYTVTDNSTYFAPDAFVGWDVIPVPSMGNTQAFPVASNTDRRLTTSVPGLSSYLSVGDDFAVDRLVSNGKVATAVVTADVTGTTLTVNSTQSFSPGDEVVFIPAVGDTVRAQVVSVLSSTSIQLSVSVPSLTGDKIHYVWKDPNSRVEFAIESGTSPWTVGDQVRVDTYSKVQDLILKSSEFPTLDPSDLKINLIGGLA